MSRAKLSAGFLKSCVISRAISSSVRYSLGRMFLAIWNWPKGFHFKSPRACALVTTPSESFHNWSTNSRWLVFSSRRDDGLFTRPYFCHVDQEGNVTKAFMLPQRNPRRFYRGRFMSFNVPDFITGPTRFDSHQASKAINDAYRKNFGVR